MPTYELTCEACGTRVERFLARILREEDKVCPNCGSTAVREGVGGGYVQAPARGSAPAGGCAPPGGIG